MPIVRYGIILIAFIHIVKKIQLKIPIPLSVEWCPVITLGVVNCADAENKGLCSQRNVDAVPDLRVT